MKKDNKFSRIIVPAVTPLTASFQLDEKAVERIFDNFYQYHVHPFILGTTGEASSLPGSLKKAFIRTAQVNKKAGAVLYAGISSNVLEESVEFAKYCADHAIDIVVATVPSYYTLTEYQVRIYFEQLANAVPLPLVIYNIPATTHISIPVTLIDELSHHPNIIGIKDSERDEERLHQSLALWKDRTDFNHFIGWAAKSAEALTNGSSGLVPSTGNLVPEIYTAMLEAVQKGDHKTAMEMQQLSDLYGNLYQAGKTLGESLWALKILMKEKGWCEPVVMPPLQPQADSEKMKLVELFYELQNRK